MSDAYTADTIPVAPVPRTLVRAVLDAHPLPQHPQFDGAPLTLTRLQDKAAWANGGRQKKARQVFDRFLAQTNEAQGARNDALYRLLMTRGIPLEVPPLEVWAADLGEVGISRDSVGPGTLKLLYVDHLLPEPLDRLKLLTRVMGASGLQAGAVETVRGLFQEALAVATVAQQATARARPKPAKTRKAKTAQGPDTGLEELDADIAASIEARAAA